jgi:DNA-directed RNA polymerase specialized sigma24 family protein
MQKKPTIPKQTSIPPLVTAVARVEANRLEGALAAMVKMQEVTKARMRAYFIEGMEPHEIAKRDGVGVETIANTVRRVRAKLKGLNAAPSDGRIEKPEILIVRVRQDDLEKVLAQMPRMLEQTKDRMRCYFLQGMAAADIAAQDGVRVEGVNSALRHVRAALSEADLHWRQASFTLTMPLLLGQELQTLSSALPQIKSRADAEMLLEPIMRAVAKARKSLES